MSEESGKFKLMRDHQEDFSSCINRCVETYKQTKTLVNPEWFETFLKILHDEWEKRKNILQLVPIPELRDIVTSILKISKEAFDEITCYAHSKKKVDLHLGAPIGVLHPEFLECQDRRFYYLKWGWWR